jgi:hypothetical protein
VTQQQRGRHADAIELEEFIRRCQDGLRHRVRGDSEPFLEMWSHCPSARVTPISEKDARTLRVTHAYRRERGEWRLILRHANQVTPEDEDREHAILGL